MASGKIDQEDVVTDPAIQNIVKLRTSIIDANKDLIELVKTVDSFNKSTTTQVTATAQLASYEKNISDLESQLNTVRLQLSTQQSKLKTVINDTISSQASFNREHAEAIKINKEFNKQLLLEADNLAGSKARVKELTKERNLLNYATNDGKKAIQDANKTIDDEIKLQRSLGTEEEKRIGGIGKYQEALSMLPQPLQNIINGFKGAYESAKAFIASPIGLIVASIAGAFALATDAIQRTTAGSRKWNETLTISKAILNACLDSINDMTFSILGLNEQTGKTTKEIGFWGSLWNISKVEATNLWNLVTSIGLAFTHPIDALHQFNNALVGLVTGSTDSYDRLSGKIDAVSKSAKTQANLESDLRAVKRKELVEDAKIEEEVSDLIVKSKQKQNYSDQERIKFLKEAISLNKEESSNHMISAALEVKASKEYLSYNKGVSEAKQRMAEANATYIRARAEANEKNRRLESQLATLIVGIEAEKQAALKKTQETRENAQKKELEYYEKANVSVRLPINENASELLKNLESEKEVSDKIIENGRKLYDDGKSLSELDQNRLDIQDRERQIKLGEITSENTLILLNRDKLETIKQSILSQIEFIKTSDLSEKDKEKALDKEKKALNEIFKIQKDGWKQAGKEAKDSLNQVTSLVDKYYSNELSQLDINTTKKEEAADREYHRNIANGMAEAEASKILSDEKTKITRDASIEEAKLKRKQAEFDKENAIAQIILKGIEAEMTAWSLLPPFNYIQAAAAAVFTGVELALAYKTPLPEIPSYYLGTKNHPGGLARVNDAGFEMIEYPTGEKIIPKGTDVVLDLPRNTKVFTHDETVKMVNSSKTSIDSKGIIDAINNKKEVHVNVNEKVHIAILEGQKRSNYINQKYRS